MPLSTENRLDGYRLILDARSGEFFRCYGMLPNDVPAERRAAVAEFLMRANVHITMGGFELDFDEGAVAFKATVPLLGRLPVADEIECFAFAVHTSIESYGDALLDVLEGKLTPAAAEEAVMRKLTAEAAAEAH